MELQLQQQRLISMEGIENSTFRALVTKLINVVLALLAVILVFISTITNFASPFFTNRCVAIGCSGVTVSRCHGFSLQMVCVCNYISEQSEDVYHKWSSRIVIIFTRVHSMLGGGGGQWPPYAFFNVESLKVNIFKVLFLGGWGSGHKNSTLCTLFIALTILDDP